MTSSVQIYKQNLSVNMAVGQQEKPQRKSVFHWERSHM